MTESIPLPLLDAAIGYTCAGLSVIATTKDKRPVTAWKQFQNAIAATESLGDMFFNPDIAQSLGIVCGNVSGNLECIDFDARGAAFNDWKDLVTADDSAVLHSVIVARTPSGGYHIVYRCPETAIPGSRKLAMRPTPTADDPYSQTVLIETRGEGGYFCAFPSPGYSLIQGSLNAIPTITAGQREIFIRSACFLNEVPQQAEKPVPVRTAMQGSPSQQRPGDDYNHRCTRDHLFDLLMRHGWQFWRNNGINTAWTRPGKNKGLSATVRNIDGVEVFYVFTSSTPFENNRGYSPFQVYAILDHHGDYAAAAAELGAQGFGTMADAFNHDAFIKNTAMPAVVDDDRSERVSDPGPFPDKLLKVSGFLGEFSEYINRCAVKRQPVISLGAAIAALGALTGRKVEGVTGLRTNFYCLGVADSGDGKDKPREMVRKLLHESGNGDLYSSDRLKSDAGIRAALELNPCTLFLLDEVGELLETIKNARHAPWLKNIITELLTLYSSAQSAGVKLGGYADAKRTLEIDCPHVCLFGTSVPKSVFRSMTMDSITGGLMGRLLIFESAFDNPRKQIPSREPIPASILDAAKFWKDFTPNGSLTGGFPGATCSPMLVGENGAATRIFDQLEEQSRKEIATVPPDLRGPYKRTEENARKLAVLAACSESINGPYIGEKSATWASELALYLTRRLVYLAFMNVAENETHERKNRVLKMVVDAGENGITRKHLISRCRFLKSRELSEVLDSLLASEEIRVERCETVSKPLERYHSN
jgi:Bifunctional DNA primase/polymerase, N-terminal.